MGSNGCAISFNPIKINSCAQHIYCSLSRFSQPLLSTKLFFFQSKRNIFFTPESRRQLSSNTILLSICLFFTISLQQNVHVVFFGTKIRFSSKFDPRSISLLPLQGPSLGFGTGHRIILFPILLSFHGLQNLAIFHSCRCGVWTATGLRYWAQLSAPAGVPDRY